MAHGVVPSFRMPYTGVATGIYIDFYIHKDDLLMTIRTFGSQTDFFRFIYFQLISQTEHASLPTQFSPRNNWYMMLISP